MLLTPIAALLLFQTAAPRKQALDELTKILPRTSTRITGRVSAFDKSWEDWVRRTGELPPDFDSLPSIPELPDPLVILENGRKTPVTSPDLWARQKRLIRSQFERWVVGRMPPPPDNLRAVVTATRREGEVTLREVRLEFGPDHRATLRLELLIPPGKGPFPVFLTNHPRSRPWVSTAVRRGYIGCIYFATDPIYGNDDDSDKFIEVYPDYDFSCLARWAWAGMRAVDYLYTLPEVDKEKIGITGHSRNGKQALIAAAFDERIGAVVASSGNTGECDPWRYTTDMFANESIEQITGSFPHWFHPRLRFFAGREHKLPVDQNSLMALVAPRGLLMASAYSETQGNPWGFEQAYRSVRRVYQFLKRPENLGLSLRPGEHATTAENIEKYVDFFDTVFGRKTFPRPEIWMHGYSFSGGGPGPWPARTASIRQKLLWALGEEPPGLGYPARRKLEEPARTSEGWLGVLYNRPLKSEGMGSTAVSFGDDLKADLYYPLNRAGKWPVVIWLHPYTYSTGYSRYTRPSFASLTRRGFAVLAFDQIGFGSRLEQARNFYQRYPNWSLLGKMAADTRAAIDAVSALEAIDSSKIYLAGYALGAKVALFTAALDERVAAVASVCGFAPLRLATPDKGAEGLRHYSHLHGLIPRFGAFVGRESQLPIDYDEILTAIAPRPVLVWAPTLDRYNPVADVGRAVAAARKAYQKLGSETALQLETPLDFNRFPASSQERVFDWLAKLP